MAHTHVSARQRWLLLESQFIVAKRIRRASGSYLQLAQPHPGQGIRAIQANRFLVGAFRLNGPARGLERLPQRHPGHAHPRSSGNGRGGHLDRGPMLAAGLRHQAHAHQRLRLQGVPLQRPLVAERHLGQPAGQPLSMALSFLRCLRGYCHHRLPHLQDGLES
jgi:hypothetical protein